MEKNKKEVKMGYSIHDASEGWEFEEVLDYGEFGIATCHIGHPIRYAYIVRNPKTGESHVYGSQCITKFWLNLYYKDLAEDKFTELYKKYQKLFVKFIKLVYQNAKYGLSKGEFPQNFEELEATVNNLKTQLKNEIKRRRGEIKKALKQIEAEQILKVRKREFLKNNEEFKVLVEHQHEFATKLHGFLLKFATNMIEKFDRWGNVHLSEKQSDILKKINEILTGEVQQTQGNPELIQKIEELVPTIRNQWLLSDFIPSILKQLEYKKNLSEKQWMVLARNGIDTNALRGEESAPDESTEDKNDEPSESNKIETTESEKKWYENSPSFQALEPKDKDTIMYSDFAFDQMRGASNKLDIGIVPPELIKRRTKTTKHGKKGSEMIYYYTRYGHSDGVALYVLKEPIEKDYTHIVEYMPLSWFFGFNNWDEAHAFAQMQAQRFNGLDRMMG